VVVQWRRGRRHWLIIGRLFLLPLLLQGLNGGQVINDF
jgi:hypothetical protein